MRMIHHLSQATARSSGEVCPGVPLSADPKLPYNQTVKRVLNYLKVPARQVIILKRDL